MASIIEYSPAALRHLKKLDRTIAAEILDYMDQRIAAASDPREFDKLAQARKIRPLALSRS